LVAWKLEAGSWWLVEGCFVARTTLCTPDYPCQRLIIDTILMKSKAGERKHQNGRAGLLYNVIKEKTPSTHTDEMKPSDYELHKLILE